LSIGVLRSVELSDSQFSEISDLVRKISGINLHDGKKELIKARLTKRMRKLDIGGFDEYLERVWGDSSGGELMAMLDALSTNLTSFFREPVHFEHLKEQVIPSLLIDNRMRHRKLRIWSAGCSSGEEPYSIAITLRESIPNLQLWDARVLATDISTMMLERGREGIYTDVRIKTISPQARSKYFTCVQTKPDRLYELKQEVRDLVHFARLNLMKPWPMRGPFDVIFCRNVMIYFDKPTQGGLVRRFWDLLAPGGTFFIGHSESLAGVQHEFKYVLPTIYKKKH